MPFHHKSYKTHTVNGNYVLRADKKGDIGNNKNKERTV